MTENVDGVFVDDNDIDRTFRQRPGSSKSNAKVPLLVHSKPGKSGASSPGLDSDDENARLLNPTPIDYQTTNNDANKDDEPEWFREFRGLPWWKRPSIYWLLPPFLLFTVAFGGVVVPKLNLIMDLVCEEYYASLDGNGDPISSPMDPGTDRCRNDAVSSRSSLFLLYGSLCSGILAAITSPQLGALSDRFGRKTFMVVNTSGALFGEILTILAAKFPQTVHVNWILVGYALEGLSGSFIVGMALAHSYASDCVAPQKRNVAFAYFHAALFGGIALGPVAAGYIIEARSKYTSKIDAVVFIFYLALAAHGLFIMFLLFCIPESLSKSRQEAAREKHREEMERLGPESDWINQLRHINLFRPLKILWPTGPGSSSVVRWNLILLAATDTIMFGIAMGAMGVVIVYTRLQFDWQTLESGRFVSIVNACRVFALLGVLPLLTRLVRGKNGAMKQRSTGTDRFDLSIIRAAIFFDTLGFIGYALAPSGTLFTLSGVVTAVGGIGSPALGAALTKHVPSDKVGQLLGATGLLHAIARVVGPTIFNGIYSATVSGYRQTVFVVLASMFGLAFLCSWFVRPHVHLEENSEPTSGDLPADA
ncbi:tetracycline-efflux transporter-like protein [Boeremia exigua]|uniref:tetracycline-efflux transporter-like protein n=1 Tax=Boeremia exigua TaxID=749465 RepID=UPI001E8CBBC9|nr:tetracycline-efflux transporter-like protein [Boeremia exigua]KAH6625747.1 tetracycline-efflux transporter-like protein [Boeremia exigua]